MDLCAQGELEDLTLLPLQQELLGLWFDQPDWTGPVVKVLLEFFHVVVRTQLFAQELVLTVAAPDCYLLPFPDPAADLEH